MSEFVISTRYANALISKSEENKTFNEVLSDIEFVKRTIESSKELRNFLANPIISAEKKMNALEEIFGKYIGKDLIDFIRFLISKDREYILYDICKRFKELSYQKLNQTEVKISSAVELSKDQENELQSKLENMIGMKVIPDFQIDKNIIGGFRARYGDTIIDASLKHQLEVLKRKLLEESYYKN